jgi:hypothetical protein
MEILGNDIFVFKNVVTGPLFTKLREIFNGVPLNRDQFKQELEESHIIELNRVLREKIEPSIHKYLLDLKLDSRPDLLDYSGCFNTDLEYYQKYKEFRNSLRDSNPIQVETAMARELHRGNLVYYGNFVEWKGYLNKFAIFVNVSEGGENTTTLKFPIQQQECTLLQGDIVVSPGGITHPYLIDVINGKLKFIQAL